MIKTGQTIAASDYLIVTTAGEALSARDAVYISASDGKAYKCDADDTTKMDFAGFAQEAAALNAAVNVVCHLMTGFSGLTINAVYYLSNTPGAISTTPGTNAAIVGFAVSASVILIQSTAITIKNAFFSYLASSRSGVSAGPASSSTQTITHNLGRIPSIIRLHSIGSWTTGSGSAMTAGGSHGTYNATGNRCVYLAAGGTTGISNTSTTFAVRCTRATSGSGAESDSATGVVQNVTATTFDIVWTVSGDTSQANFVWEAI